MKEKSVQGWLERLKDMAYQMDNVVDEWSTAILQLQIKGAESASMSKKKVSSCIPSPSVEFTSFHSLFTLSFHSSVHIPYKLYRRGAYL